MQADVSSLFLNCAIKFELTSYKLQATSPMRTAILTQLLVARSSSVAYKLFLLFVLQK